MNLKSFLRYANLPVFGFFIWAMATASNHGWNRYSIFALFLLYALVRVTINLWINKEQVKFVGEVIDTMKKTNKKNSKR